MKSVVTALTLLCSGLLGLASSDTGQIVTLSDGTKHLNDKIVVVMKSDVPSLIINQEQNSDALTGIESIDRICRDFKIVEVEPLYKGILRKPALIREVSRIYIFTLADPADPLAVIPILKNDPHIATAELYTIAELNYEPDDPFFDLQWYLAYTHAPEAWDTVRGDTTRHSIIGIVDTGVDWEHGDLHSNIWINNAEDLNHNNTLDQGDLNGIDDDGNGFVDDVVGWDFGADDNDPRENYAIHGSAVAGCASEATDNDLLGAGMGFSARLMCLKAADSNGNFPVDIWPSMVYAGDNGAQIVNCSWGTVAFNQYEQNIINALWEEDVLVIASAGALSDSTRVYPAAYEHVMAVTATDHSDHKAYFAGYGTWVDISAPGLDILVIYGDDYITATGTSFSTGLVSGLAALVRAWYPYMTNDEAEQLIKDSADPIDDLNPGYRGLLGAGRINAEACVQTAIDEFGQRPIEFSFARNYPNPFNSSTVLSYALSRQSLVTISIYNLSGQKVAVIFRGEQPAGEHSLVWRADDYPSGIYFARLEAGERSQNIKMVLLK